MFYSSTPKAAQLLLLASALYLAPATAQTATQASPQGSTVPLPITPALTGVPFSPAQLTSLLPATVYFQGKTASLQLRNAAGTTFPGNDIVWIALVDSSGYASSVQQKYQFYLVTEAPLRIGSQQIGAGAYGGGFLADHFVLMDIGGHDLATGPVQTDTGLRRPRPLELLPDAGDAVKLYLGRRWVELRYAGTAFSR